MSILVILDHHTLGYISLWYGTMTLVTGISLLIIYKTPPFVKKIRYLRLLHLLLGIATAFLGLLTYIATL
ncbi:MAG: hypothetical protein NZ992_04105 [Candidatus Korarchaeum sp.]|nr:hypothetical protein [Candidatus Korarchaeum sp.]MDW8035971.1 hypothetical protein [Candidatus Korarchaeum sp.]